MSGSAAELKHSVGVALFVGKKLTGRKGAGSENFVRLKWKRRRRLGPFSGWLGFR